MSAKRKGTRNEHRAIRILEAAGYHCTRAAGSLGAWDIVALGRQGVRLVQVKSNRNASPLEREQLARGTAATGCRERNGTYMDTCPVADRRSWGTTKVPSWASLTIMPVFI